MSGELDRLQKKWVLLKGLDQKHEIDRLRLRADVAECIRDCYKAGITRSTVSKELEVSGPRVTRLVQGNYRADEATIHRTPSNYRLKYVEVEPEIVYIERPKTPDGSTVQTDPVCLYCSGEAAYRVEWENKEIFVCQQHKPPEVEDDDR